jgi:hypothetical protein
MKMTTEWRKVERCKADDDGAEGRSSDLTQDDDDLMKTTSEPEEGLTT